jgi:hypothetical protein
MTMKYVTKQAGRSTAEPESSVIDFIPPAEKLAAADLA